MVLSLGSLQWVKEYKTRNWRKPSADYFFKWVSNEEITYGEGLKRKDIQGGKEGNRRKEEKVDFNWKYWDKIDENGPWAGLKPWNP